MSNVGEPGVPFNLLSDRIEEAKACLRDATRPLFRRDDKGNPSFVGSSVLLALGGSHFLVSAAHVFDRLRDGVYLLEGSNPKAPLTNRPICTAMPLSGKREDDRYDVGFVLLTPKEVADLNSLQFINEWHLQVNDIRRFKSAFFFMSYPATKQKVYAWKQLVKIEPYAYWSVESKAGAYEAYSGSGIEADTHLLMQFNHDIVRDRQLKRRTPPGLYGASGGGVWRIANPSVPIRPDKLPFLVGIFTGYDKAKARALVVVRIGVLCDLVAHAHPEIADALPRNIEIAAYPDLSPQ